MQNLSIQTPQVDYKATVKQVPANGRLDVHGFAIQLQKSVSDALNGPNGTQPLDVIAALAALGGYCARWQTHVEVQNNRMVDDFNVPAGCNMPYVETSKQVEEKICALTGRSFASTLISAMMVGGADWLPHIDRNIDHNFLAINKPQFPDYSGPSDMRPQMPPQSLLLMLWDSQVHKINTHPHALDLAVTAYAVATANVILENADTYTPSKTAQMALETAVATSRLSYGF